MAKRAHHRGKKKKREAPWLAAARQKLKERDEAEVTGAFVDLVAPVFDRLDPNAPDASFQHVLDMALLVWNLPILHALSTEEGSDGAQIRARTEAMLGSLRQEIGLLTPMFEARSTAYRHFERPVARAEVRRRSGQLRIAVLLGAHVEGGSFLDIGEDGLPKVSHSLLALSAPVRDRLPRHYSQEEAEAAIGLATIAWNLPVLSESIGSIPDSLVSETLEAAAVAHAMTEPMRGRFAAMIEARRKRFAYDPRIVGGTTVNVVDHAIHVTAASLHRAPAGTKGLTVPVTRSPGLLDDVRQLLRSATEAGEI